MMSDQETSNRRMLTAGVIILVTAAVAFATAATITGQGRWYGAAATSALAALGPGSQLAFGTLRLEWAATWSAVVIAIGQGLSDVPETETLAGVALVTLGVSAATFLRRRVQAWSAGVFAIVIVLVSVWWNPDQGLGLGLSICDRIARLLGHELSLRSAPGRGSVFAISVPVGRAPPAEPVTPSSADTSPVPSSLVGLPVLCIDNEPEILVGMSALMSRWGVRVLVATTAAEARDLAAREHPFVVLADHRLAESDPDGLELLQELCGAQRAASAAAPAGRTAPS